MTSACDLAIAEFFFGVRADPLQFWDAVNRVDRETETVRLVAIMPSRSTALEIPK
jgi:hypothetical protein